MLTDESEKSMHNGPRLLEGVCDRVIPSFASIYFNLTPWSSGGNIRDKCAGAVSRLCKSLSVQHLSHQPILQFNAFIIVRVIINSCVMGCGGTTG